MLVLLLVFELGKVGVVVKFLSVYPVALYFWAGVLVWHPARFFIFPDLTFAMCLVMADLRSCVWELTWYALYRLSLKQNPLISHNRKACLGWFWTLCPEKMISSLVSLSFHSLSVDLF